MIEIMAVGVTSVAIVALFLVYINRQYEMWGAEKRDLMNRIMARDYEQYANVNIKVAQAAAPVEVVSVEDIEKRIAENTAGISI